jgi:hypothetical protein
MVLDRGVFFRPQDAAATSAGGKEVIMWKVLKLVSGIIALGTSVLAAVAATGVAGDGLAETFGGAGDEKGSDGAVSRKAC